MNHFILQDALSAFDFLSGGTSSPELSSEGESGRGTGSSTPTHGPLSNTSSDLR